MFYWIVMDVIQMMIKVLLITAGKSPITSLPNLLFPFGSSALAGYKWPVGGFSRNITLDQPPTSGMIAIILR
jgi:hypothetical protein